MANRRWDKGARSFVTLTLAGFAQAALAQTAPDAGRTLQQEPPVLQVPKASPGVIVETPRPAVTAPGGAQVVLESVSFTGNTVFSEAQLLAVLGDIKGKPIDFAGMRELAARIADHYRSSGYPFARAVLPPQPLQAGALRIEVIEGRYGEVTAKGAADLTAGAQRFLSPLKPGDVIESAPLERATLILSDQPGLRVVPTIRPGQALGTGDLDAEVTRTERISGDVGLDNFGNRYTGENRARLNVNANSPFMLGDQLALRGLLTEQGMWYGSLGYSLPLGPSGLRAQASYAHTYYELGKDFASLDATGTADVTSLGLSYPIVRSQRANLTVAGAYQHKELHDKQGAVGSSSDKSSDSLPLTLSYDLRDRLGGGGITYGALTWTSGRLKLDSTLAAADRLSAKTEGRFHKINLDVARIQTITGPLSAYGRFSGQWAGKNLDSSEGFGLGGATGVRAYPVGEAYGDEGWLTQWEIRYTSGGFTPYGFYDAGEIRVDAKPFGSGTNKRSIAGAGAGLRYQIDHWSIDVALAWRTRGGRPQSDTADRDPRGWLTLRYTF
jgi:hemolysin activation/secretion protein